MKVVIVPIYKRIELAKLCISRLVEQGENLGFDVMIVGTKSDLDKLPEGCIKVYHDNPVSDKLNHALSHCKDYSKVMIWGSDNFASDLAIERLFKSRSKIVGYDSIYFHRVKDGKWSIWSTDKMTIGVGRTYSKKALEAVDYKLYDKGLNKGLDNNARKKYDKETTLKLGDDWLIDVKYSSNITNHNIVDLGEECNPVGDIDFSELVETTEKPMVKHKAIAFKPIEKELVTIETIKDFSGMKKGTVKRIPKRIANNLEKRKLIKIK